MDREERLRRAAWLQGRGPAYEQVMLNREYLDLKKQEQHKQAMAQDLRAMNILGYQGDIRGIEEILESRVNTLQQTGGDFTESLGTLQLLRTGDPQNIGNVLADLAQAEQIAVANGYLEPITGEPGKRGLASAKTTHFDNGTQLLTLPDGNSKVFGPDGIEVTDPRERRRVLKEAREEQILFQRRRSRAGAEGELEGQRELLPEVQAAVTRAVEGAKAEAKIADKGRSNEAALQLYNTGMNGLVEAMGGTVTGPVFGWFPAVTANQQIAEGAVAAMAPILKQMFRAAGEGIFTDRDQQLLLDMVPTRKDQSEAILWKIQNINNIVQAKLGGVAEPQNTPALDAAGGSFKLLKVE